MVDGQKIWTSRAQQSDLMILLARTTPLRRGGEAHRRACRVFLVDMRDRGAQLTINPIAR